MYSREAVLWNGYGVITRVLPNFLSMPSCMEWDVLEACHSRVIKLHNGWQGKEGLLMGGGGGR